MNATMISLATNPDSIRIVVVEDHAMFQQAMVHYVTAVLGHQVVGTASTGAEAVDVVAATNPALILLDLLLPDGDGFAVAEKVLASRPQSRILVISSHCDDYTLYKVEKSGVSGFVDKNSQTLERVGDAIAAVIDGRCYYAPVFLEAKLARLNDERAHTKVLSDWQRCILSLIGQSLTDDEIAERLNLSPKTVATHRGVIMRKLGIPSTPKLINFALAHGFTHVPPRRGAIPVYL